MRNVTARVVRKIVRSHDVDHDIVGRSYKMLSPPELKLAFENRNTENMQRVVEGFMPMVIQLSGKMYKHTGCRFSQCDLIQAGSIGMIHAYWHYDMDRGFKFITYAYHAVWRHMQRYVQSNYGVIHIPREALWNAMSGDDEGLKSHFEHMQTIRELSESTDMDPKVYGLHMRKGGNFDGAEDDGAFCSYTFSVKEDHRRRDDLVDAHDMMRVASEILTQREFMVLQSRLKCVKLREIGAEIGVTRERVRQIEAKAIEKLQAHYNGF